MFIFVNYYFLFGIIELVRENNINKFAAGRKLIRKRLNIVRRKKALDKIRLREWTLWKAARYCGESYRSMLRLLKEENISYPLSLESLKYELEEFD